MCGIAGLLGMAEAGGQESLATQASSMAQVLAHRGPDDHGVWHDDAAGIALAHRRLAVIDLSASGHQPMVSRNGRYVLVYNGEIYNHLAIRREIERQQLCTGWRGHSDTETLLAAICGWGIEPALRRAVGMFAFALWDREDRTLTLARDRLGEKPLYYGRVGNCLAFASELKSMSVLADFEARVDRSALRMMLSKGYVPDPFSIFAGIRKLEPGTTLTVSAARPQGVSRTYWSAADLYAASEPSAVPVNETLAADELERLLSDAVKSQMIADVPIGAFLSGGIDSSLIVALMQKQASSSVQTFTVAFGEKEFDESKHALAVARHLRTDHTELQVSPADAMREVPLLAGIYDEPLADASQLPMLLVSRLARRKVTVSLSGDGGDELFGGYNRHMWGARLWKRLAGKPAFARRALGRLIQSLPSGALASAHALLPARLQYSSPAEKLQKLAFAMGAVDQESFFDGLTTRWPYAHRVVLNLPGADPLEGARSIPAGAGDDWMMLRDLQTYLPGDVLVKVDRAAMSASLETRAPYLDHRVVEFALRVPLEFKIRDGQGKWLLRQVLYRHVPRELMERPKMGFAVPIRDWLRGPLREWAEDLLSTERLLREGYFKPALIRKVWLEHVNGRRDHSEKIWGILSFQAWLQHW
jgi:asparagine synthase (glutamine-hydrolysing)